MKKKKCGGTRQKDDLHFMTAKGQAYRGHTGVMKDRRKATV